MVGIFSVVNCECSFLGIVVEWFWKLEAGKKLSIFLLISSETAVALSGGSVKLR